MYTRSWEPSISPRALCPTLIRKLQMPGIKSWAIHTTPKSMDLSDVIRNIHRYCIFQSSPFTVCEELFEISVHTMGKYANPLAVLTSTCDCMLAYVRIWASRALQGWKGKEKRWKKFVLPSFLWKINFIWIVRAKTYNQRITIEEK